MAAFFPALLSFEPQYECVVSNNKHYFTYALYILPMLTIVLVTAIPDAIFFMANIAIMIRVQRMRNDVTSTGSQTDTLSQGRITRTAVTLSLTHLLLTLPGIINTFVAKRQVTNVFYSIGDVLLFSLGAANFGINILIYLITSHIFRQELYEALKKLCPTKCYN